MKLQAVEKWWLRIGVSMLFLFFVVAVVDAFVMGNATPHGMKMVDPQKVSTTPPFDKPGIISSKGNKYKVAIVAYTFGFRPANLTIPEGAEVEFQIATSDVVHGYQIPGKTNVNAMVIPGFVTTVKQTFSKPGRYLVLCNEYCGMGHQHMTMHIDVKKKGSR